MARLLGLAAIAALAVLGGAGVAAAQYPISPEVRVHSSSARSEEEPAVAIDQFGRSIVVWSSSNEEILIRPFDPFGVAASGESRLSSSGFGFRASPRVALDREGRGFAAWSSSEESGLGLAGPFARCVNSFSEVTCPVFAIPTGDADLNGSSPALAAADAGSSASAVWFSIGTETRSDRLAGGSFDDAGEAIAPNFVVDSMFDFDSPAPGRWRVASLPGSRIVVVWSKYMDEQRGHDVVGRVFSIAGVPLSAEFLVPSSSTGEQLVPDVASAASGEFVVVWEDRTAEADGSGVYGQRFGTSGERIGASFRISSEANSPQIAPAVAMDSTANFVVAFTSFSESPESSVDIFLRAYGDDGNAIGEQVWVTEGAPAGEEQTSPAIALSDAGTLVVAYESYRCEGDQCGKDVMARWYSLPCAESESTLCLLGGRFRVRAFWKVPDGARGVALSLPLTVDSGGFTFFSPSVFEILVKLVDGCGFNDRFWVYAAGLTDVEVALLVQDSWTGHVTWLMSDLGAPFLPYQSIDAFPTCFGQQPGASRAGSPVSKMSSLEPPVFQGALQLREGRFLVTAHWRDFQGQVGAGLPLLLSDESGLFSFFSPQNLEVGIKVLDGCSVNDAYWVYAAGLTNLQVEIEVLDTATQSTWSYENQLGTPFPPVLDSSAFRTCPETPLTLRTRSALSFR